MSALKPSAEVHGDKVLHGNTEMMATRTANAKCCHGEPYPERCLRVAHAALAL